MALLICTYTLHQTASRKLNGIMQITATRKVLPGWTDMADEMTRFSKESILQQAATSMLAQANQSNQGVLSLLQ